MPSSWRALRRLLPWLLALFVALAPLTAKTASRKKFSDTLEYQGAIALQLVEASAENCLYGYDFASGDSFYNYFRDYSPQTGRYPQSDPIGLLGGVNTYNYPPNPLSWTDPLGLSSINVGDFNQALNCALKHSGAGGKGSSPNPAKFDPGYDYNGRKNACGGFRLEHDQRHGAHINSWRGKDKLTICFPASKKTVNRLNRRWFNR